MPSVTRRKKLRAAYAGAELPVIVALDAYCMGYNVPLVSSVQLKALSQGISGIGQLALDVEQSF